MPHPRLLVLLAVLLSSLCVSPASPAAGQRSTTSTFETDRGTKITVEGFGEQVGRPTLILLHGASGPVYFYQQQARYFAAHGYHVLMPHYFDAARSGYPSDQNYRRWSAAMQTLIGLTRASDSAPNRQIVLVGYSLGASVALSVGSQDPSLTAIAEWYGSLPDAFFYAFRGMPPLLILHGEQDDNIPVANARQLMQLCTMKQLTCEKHLYPDQAHGFDPKALEDADARTLAFLARFVQALP
jgi:carboxymethylenebutenolidase